MDEEKRSAWLVTQYESVRGEIGDRASVHHSFLGWSVALAAGFVVLGTEVSLAWLLPIPVVAWFSAWVVHYEWQHTKRLGDYAARLEAAIAADAGMELDPLRGWELHLKVLAESDEASRWLGPDLRNQ